MHICGLQLTLVHNAAYNGHLKCLRYLVDELHLDPAYPNKDAITPLHNATFNGHGPCAKFLLEEACVDPNPANRSKLTPIRNACANNHYAVVRVVASYGSDYRLLDNNQLNALQHASDKRKATIAVGLGMLDHVWRRRHYALMLWMSWNDASWKVDNLGSS